MYESMSGTGYTTQYLRTVNISKSVIKSVKECGPTRHPALVEKFQHNSVLKNAKTIKFSPRSINIEIGERNNNITRITDFPIARLPVTNPLSIVPVLDIVSNLDLNLPPKSNEEIQAARLIVIRRKKMRKHKLRKLRKRMRYKWARVKQRRRQRKEKAFRAELLAMVKDSEQFSAEKYVADKIAEANHTPLPRLWKGKRLPQFIIRQLMGIDKKINYKHTDVYKA